MKLPIRAHASRAGCARPGDRRTRLRRGLAALALAAATAGTLAVHAASARAAAGAHLSITLSASPGSFNDSHDRIVFRYEIRNNQATAARDISVFDRLPGTVCTVRTLAAGGTASCTREYSTTAADVARGSISNTATAIDADGGAGTSNTVTLAYVPGLTLTLSATVVGHSHATTFHEAGTPIVFRYLLRNSSNHSITGLVSIFSRPFGHVCTHHYFAGLGGEQLRPGGELLCSALYHTTEADVRNRSVTNTATADSFRHRATSNTVTLTYAPCPDPPGAHTDAVTAAFPDCPPPVPVTG